MVFEPTFEEIGDDADGLPDLEGSGPGADRTEGDGGLKGVPPAADEDQDDAVEGEAEASTLAAGDVTANDLPPYGN